MRCRSWRAISTRAAAAAKWGEEIGVKNLRGVLLWGVTILVLVALFNLFRERSAQSQLVTVPYSEFVESVDTAVVLDALIDGDRISGRLRDGTAYLTYRPGEGDIVQRLVDNGVTVEVKPADEGSIWSSFAFWLPMLALLGVWLFFFSRMPQGGRNPLTFGRSRARMLTEKTGTVTFENVAGIDEAKDELEEIVEFLRNPQQYSRLGGKIPKGALLIGPPGTGKTLLARAIAGEAGVPFFTISGSDFVEMFVGVGASRVRDMFEQAKKNAPCIVFIDEIDAVGRHRGIGYGGGNDEREQTLNQLLVEMDGFEANEGVILIAATNRPDVLDPALLRPGRFDRQVTVPNPDVGGREKILRVHAREVPVAPDVCLRTIARGTPGFSGADLANLVNEAALLAARLGKRLVTMEDFESAKDRVMMGTERRSLVMTEDERRLTAYHEAGHAVVGLNLPGHDPIHKATIIPRGRALGLVLALPERDHLSMTRRQLEAKIAMAMGGRVAEQLIFGADSVTSGAASDIQQITRIARAMVTQFGMSDRLGTIDYAEDRESFLGVQRGSPSVSPGTQGVIDEEIRNLVERGTETAMRILQERRTDLERLAQGLLEYETLTGEEIAKVVAGEKLNRGEEPGESAAGAEPGVATVPRTRRRRPGTDPSPQQG